MVLITKAKYIGKEEFEMACSMVAKILEANPPTLLNAPHFVIVLIKFKKKFFFIIIKE